MNSWNIPDEIHNAVGALMEDNAKLKTLVAQYAATITGLTVKAAAMDTPGPPPILNGKVAPRPPAVMLVGDVINFLQNGPHPGFRDLPEDIQKESKAIRLERWGIK